MKKDDTKKLIIRPGTMKTWSGGRWASIYCSIKFTQDGRLSISGVIGPIQSGNSLGGCGQINMEFKHRNPAHDNKRYSNPMRPSDIRFRPGWNVKKWYTFLEYWKLYHLNDMQPGCKHQQAEGWGKKEIKLVKVEYQSWKLQRYGHKERSRLIKQDLDFINKAHSTQALKSINLKTFEGRLFAKVKTAANKGKVYSPAPDSAAATWIGNKKPIKITMEIKSSNWVHPEEHPDGVLTKPCPTCGYKYGTAWMKSKVPQDVIDWLFLLPPADQTPAWV